MTLYTVAPNYFSNTSLYLGNRPYADVLLNPIYVGAPTHKCLVDTGADFLQLPASAAAASGLSLATAIMVPVSTAGGSAMLQKLSGIVVKIEGVSVIVDVLFDPTNTAPLIAGRQILLAAFDIGLDVNAWFW